MHTSACQELGFLPGILAYCGPLLPSGPAQAWGASLGQDKFSWPPSWAFGCGSISFSERLQGQWNSTACRFCLRTVEGIFWPERSFSLTPGPVSSPPAASLLISRLSLSLLLCFVFFTTLSPCLPLYLPVSFMCFGGWKLYGRCPCVCRWRARPYVQCKAGRPPDSPRFN